MHIISGGAQIGIPNAALRDKLVNTGGRDSRECWKAAPLLQINLKTRTPKTAFGCRWVTH